MVQRKMELIRLNVMTVKTNLLFEHNVAYFPKQPHLERGWCIFHVFAIDYSITISRLV